MDYKSQKAHFATYTDGAQGITYTLSLDNDFDVLVFDQQNTRISSLPITVKTTRQLNGDTTDTGSLTIKINSQSTWTAEHYKFYESENTLKIIGVPDDFTEAAFQIEWTIKTLKLTKTFTLKKQISNVDYEIEVDKSVINSTNLGGTVKIKIKKKDINGSKYLTKNDLTTNSLTLTSNQDLTWNSGGYWMFNYGMGQAGAVTITLKQNTLVWDTETIEFVLDGKSGQAKKINTYHRDTLPETSVQTNSVRQHYGKNGHEEWWFTDIWDKDKQQFVPYDNEHINIGDFAYISGTTSDTALPYSIYGTVLNKKTDYQSNVYEPKRKAIQL